MTIPVAVPQWRIDPDREKAALDALAAGADQLYLDFGGARRGARLDEPGQLAAALDLAQIMAIPVLAVHGVDDIGFADPSATALLEAAFDCALALGVRTLYVPGFRKSSPDSPERLAQARTALVRICERARGSPVTIAYASALGAEESVALARAVDRPELRVVLDIGALIEAGHNPEEFAEVVRRAELLLPDVHAQDPASAPGRAIALLPALVSRGVVGSVLVANDYLAHPRLLRSDIERCRSLGARRSRTIRLPY
ncbi:TIM barrel protein [Segniliparus rugosus]|uniref:Xylose isomerase-like TIM barrel domain-containing protein n=1 Tax=Segniliparus rugosus (strain ATCC BAA-974 / DSM 45345 / CCUG 50838 / CIP 108380 / JCM 13579 / CDC 945) TaxID=679197 RepID=E5XRQ5_SEGRC|nr:TIM barrel protein [Segniliparus rugosus]EFV12920.1 hypothetical protein HMPREF9336_02177 [Segniliparus rugosus ATCC BAA-974]